MLVSDIIANGKLLADVPGTDFFTDPEALSAVQAGWKEVYSLLSLGSDDFFTKQVYVDSSTFTADANRKYTYYYNLPDDFMILRLLQHRKGSENYQTVHKMTMEEVGNSQSSPGYRIVGKSATGTGGQIMIYNPGQSTGFAVWYVPVADTLLTTTNLNYPNSFIPEILSYQVAIEIRRKQNLDDSGKTERKKELIKSMMGQATRDENRAEVPKNIFSAGFYPYI